MKTNGVQKCVATLIFTIALGASGQAVDPTTKDGATTNAPKVALKTIVPVDTAQVRLLPGSVFYERQELHRTGYVGSFDPDKLLFEYRKLAKLPQKNGVNGGYGGWDSGFIRGHMAGHYLSAAARMVAATGDAAFKDKANYLVAELAKCQQALGPNGYLAAFPTGAFDVLEGKRGDGAGVVVPYYTIHKIMAGLLDVYHYLGNRQALEVAVKMADYFAGRLKALKPEEIERIFRTTGSRNPQNEFGAMSDVLVELYVQTGEQRHLEMAKIFNRPWFVEPLAAGEDQLTGLHANTHVAQALGVGHYALLTGEKSTTQAAYNFWKIVTEQHSFVIGGNSFKEWFDQGGVEAGPSIDGRKELPSTTAESCNTHNMLKLTAYLFALEPRAAYADYFERALYNHLLATIAPDNGTVTYFTPLRGQFRTYLKGTYCCVGSGIENAARFNDGIYFQKERTLWVNLYIPSELTWKEAGLTLRQEGDITKGEPAKFTVVGNSGTKPVTLNFRAPHWISTPATVAVNGTVQQRSTGPSSYMTLEGTWKQGDVITVTLPRVLRLEKAKDVPNMVALFYGPVLLAGELGRENMPRDDMGENSTHERVPPANVPDIQSSSTNPADWLTPEAGKPLVFKMHGTGPADGIIFRPLYDLHHQRYSVYWRLAAQK